MVAEASLASQSLAEVRPARINRLKDKKGTLHITCVRSSPEFKPPAVEQMPLSRQAKKQGEPQSPGLTRQAKASGSRQDGQDEPAAHSGAGTNNPQGAGRAELPTANVAASNGAEEFCSLEQLNPDGAYEGVSRMALFVDQNGKMYIFRSKVEVLDSPGPETARLAGQGGIDLETRPALADQATPLVVPAAMQSKTKPQASLPAAAAERPQVWATGKIRIFRDGKGFTHIVNNPKANSHFAAQKPPKPVITPVVCAVPETPGPQPNQGVVTSPPEGLKSGFSRIVSFLDKAGTLTIANPKARALNDLPLARGRENGDLEALMSLAAQQYRLPLPLVKAVVRAESGFVTEAVSRKGAMGLMQLMPVTAACLGVKDPFCPQENIMGGCRYLRDLLDRLNGSVPLGLAAYNAGLQRVINSGYQIPAITETQDFVDKVLGYFFSYLQQASSDRKI